MYPVTSDYETGIYALSRRVLGRVTFDISPTDLDSDTNTISASAAFAISDVNQLDDNLRENSLKLITWEQNRTKLDGTFTFASESQPDWGHVGWASEMLSDEDGFFSSPQTVQFLYGQTHTSAGVTVTFDKTLDEFAVDFTISVYGASNNLIHQEVYVGNSDAQVLMLVGLPSFKKIVVSITKWSHQFHRARVAEIDVGAVLVYDNDKLIRFSATEEIDPTSASLAIPEFEFSIDNTTKEFDMFNPTGIYVSLEQRQQIVPELGLELENRIEWVPLGVYLLSEWRSDAGSMTATFKGRSKLDLLDSFYYEQLTAVSGLTLKSLMETILDGAGVTGYYIDEALSAIATNGISERRTAREALQLAAIAGCATIRVTRDNILRVETTRETTSVNTISFDEMLQEPQIELQRPTQKVTVYYYSNASTEAGQATATESTIESGDLLALERNTFINTAVRALAVAQWVLSRRQERKKITLNYRGNPALELYDFTALQNRYIASAGTYLTKIELSYEGYLQSRIEGRSV
jgi:hypothetical protein